MPLVTWNLHLVNIQVKARNHIWEEHTTTAPTPSTKPLEDTLIRLPANSKTRLNITTEHAHRKQTTNCNSFLHATGINRDLVPKCPLLRAPPEDPYRPPTTLDPLIPLGPELLASDLFQCSTTSNCTYTVEDKDPSVLWEMHTPAIFNFWYKLLSPSPDRWEIIEETTEQILKSTAPF